MNNPPGESSALTCQIGHGMPCPYQRRPTITPLLTAHGPLLHCLPGHIREQSAPGAAGDFEIAQADEFVRGVEVVVGLLPGEEDHLRPELIEKDLGNRQCAAEANVERWRAVQAFDHIRRG